MENRPKPFQLQARHWPSKTRHSLNGAPAQPFARLEIATTGQDEGCYLLHICADGSGTDTWHETLDDALGQEEFEFGVKLDEWQSPM